MRLTRSPCSCVASSTVKIGEMYWIVVALANGICFTVTKNKNSAVIPAIPRMISHFLLLPKKGILRFLIQTTQMINEMTDLKKTISCVGMSSKYFTQKLTTA